MTASSTAPPRSASVTSTFRPVLSALPAPETVQAHCRTREALPVETIVATANPGAAP